MFENKQLPVFGLIISISFIIATYLVVDTVKHVILINQIIKVRGYAEKLVTADNAKLHISYAVSNKNVSRGYEILESQTEVVEKFLKKHKLLKEELRFSPISLEEKAKKNSEGYATNEIDYYVLNQAITIISNDIDKIAKLSTRIDRLMKDGIDLQVDAPHYYYSKINELKSELLIMATKDARMRAETLAEGSGSQLGFLKAARQGRFSIRSGDSASISSDDDYSSDDTKSQKKRITAVVTVDYSMK